MSSMRFRAVRCFSRGGKRTSRIVERLEPRCVLSAAALYAPPMSPGRHVDFVDGAAIEHSARAPIGFADSSAETYFAGGMELMSPGGYGHAPPMDTGFASHSDGMFVARGNSNSNSAAAPRVGSVVSIVVTESVYSVDFGGAHYLVMFIDSAPSSFYQSTPYSTPNNYVQVSAPAEHISYPHVENAIVDAPTPVAATPSDPAPRSTGAPGGNSSGAVTIHSPAAEGVLASSPNSTNSSTASNTHAASTVQFATGNLHVAGAAARTVQTIPERIVVHVVQGAVVPSSATPAGESAVQNQPTAEAVAAGSSQAIGVAPGTIADAMTTDMPSDRTALANVPINLLAVEQALQSVMGRVAVLGAELNSWLDDPQLAPMFAAVAGATLGAGAACYLRRRNAVTTLERDEQVSSSWLFARMQHSPR
jgi:hypothetical protein